MRALILLFISLFSAALAGDGVRATGHDELRLNELLWHEVRNHAGESLGAVSDVLVQMPSGRIVFVAVMPREPFQRPKAVPPDALSRLGSADQTLRIDMSKEQWITAPALDWDGALVIKNTDEGRRIYGYYQQAWREPDPTPVWGMIVVGQPTDAEPAARYVSLKKLLLNRVVTRADEYAGFLLDFLIDWKKRRATHALVSPEFTPLYQPDATWLAIPTLLLLPPAEHDSLMANTDGEALSRATPLKDGERLPTGEAARIFRYPATPGP